jgi:NADH:ubiquinone oxidoreductase subunit 4 (subunit M)
MHFELLGLLFIALSFGLVGLLWGLRGYVPLRVVTVLIYSLSLYGALALTLFILCGRVGAGSLAEMFSTVVGGAIAASLVGGWQYSTLLACVLPSIVFGFLFVTKPTGFTLRGLLALGFLLFAGILFVITDTLLWWLISFELLLLVSLYLLRLTSKSERIGEAVTEMFFWTLAGSICLLFGLVKQATKGHLFLEALHEQGGLEVIVGFLFLVGFGVKLPLWPCFSWLLKAHVEASVEFSILLSGVVVKFGALGLYRVFLLQSAPLSAHVIVACGTLAIIEAALRLVTQRDLKRVVALTTVIEMN